jgi:hypothetical protein
MEIEITSIEKAQLTRAKSQSGNTANQEYLFNVVNTLTEYACKNDNSQLFYLHQIKAVIRNEVILKTRTRETLTAQKTLSDKDKQTLKILLADGINPLNIDITDTRLPQIREQLYSLANNNTNIKRKVAYKGTKQKIVIIYNSEILDKYAKTSTHAKQLLESVNKLKSL